MESARVYILFSLIGIVYNTVVHVQLYVHRLQHTHMHTHTHTRTHAHTHTCTHTHTQMLKSEQMVAYLSEEDILQMHQSFDGIPSGQATYADFFPLAKELILRVYRVRDGSDVSDTASQLSVCSTSIAQLVDGNATRMVTASNSIWGSDLFLCRWQNQETVD